MSVHTKVSGVWKEITGIWVKISGTWKEITGGHVNISSTWKEFYAKGGLPETLIALFSATPDSPWTVLNGTAASPDLCDVYMRGGDSEGEAEAGSNTHTHTSESFSTGNSTTSNYISYNYNCKPVHTHTMNHGHTDGDNNEPSYYTMIPAIGGAELPQNTLLFYDGAAAPTGWTAWSTVYDKFIKCSETAGNTGGAASHSHAYTGYSGYDNSTVRCRDQPPYCSIGKPHNHRHTINHTHSGGENYPLWYGLLPIRNDAATSEIPAGTVAFFTGDTLPDGWSDFTAITGNNKFVHCKSTNGATGGADTHGHSHSGSTGSYNGTPYSLNCRRHARCYKPHSHGLNGTHTSVSNVPLHWQLLCGKKDA